MNTFAPSLADRLGTVAKAAFESSAFYERLYGSIPLVSSLDEFQALPIVTHEVLDELDAATTLAYIDGEQLLMELNPCGAKPERLPLSPLENEYDMQRRYRRMTRLLLHGGAEPSNTALVCDDASIYAAAEIERVLPWPIAIVLRTAASEQVANILDDLGVKSVIWVAQCEPVPGRNCTSVFTLGRQSSPGESRSCRVVDICTTQLLPWVAASDDNLRYSALAGQPADDGSCEPDIYFEMSADNTLLVTALHDAEELPATAVVRYDTKLAVESVTAHSFVVARAICRS